jgi:WD40 repeat protein
MFFLKGFEGEVADASGGLRFTSDGLTLLSAHEDQSVRVWDVAGRELRKTLRGHTSFVSGLCLIPGTTRCVTGSWDETIRVWDYQSGKKVKLIKRDDSVIAVDASPDGKTLAAVGGDWFGVNGVWRWDTTTWKEKPAIGTHETQIGVVRYSPDGKLLITGAADHLACVWDAETGEQRARLKHTHWVQGLAFHGQTMAVAAGRRVTLWSLPEGESEAQQLQVLEGYKATALTVAFSPDGRLLATGGKDGCVRIWDRELNRFTQNYRWKIGEVHALAFAPDGMTVAAGGVGSIVVWDVD